MKDGTGSTTLSKTDAALLASVQFCQRQAHRLEPAQRETLWFPLLDAVMAAQQRAKADANQVGSRSLVAQQREKTDGEISSSGENIYISFK